MISFDEAYRLTLDHIQSLDVETVALIAAGDRITGRDLVAKVDSPSRDVSLRDGYAVLATDVRAAGPESPVRLSLVGSVAAGGNWQGTVHRGEAVRILTGAPLPQGADAILAEEFSQALPGAVHALSHAEPGRNILPQGTDVKAGQLLVSAGRRLHPTAIGLLAAGGYHEVPVVRRPRVAVLATGDEVLAPGEPLVQGKLYASNLYTLAAWCLRYGFEAETLVVQDDADAIRQVLAACLEQADAVLTSGGAWKGERDLVLHSLDSLGWQKVYHQVRIAPGKGVGFGLFQNKPIFCLPGVPPANHMAFLQLGLPGLQKLAGYAEPGLRLVPAVMAETVSGQLDWTQFIHGRLIQAESRLFFQPMRYQSRLLEMAHTEAVARIPEGLAKLTANSTVLVQVLG
jgi:molybdopterin molybdotransferase